jgi:hypothetical protein
VEPKPLCRVRWRRHTTNPDDLNARLSALALYLREVGSLACLTVAASEPIECKTSYGRAAANVGTSAVLDFD